MGDSGRRSRPESVRQVVNLLRCRGEVRGLNGTEVGGGAGWKKRKSPRRYVVAWIASAMRHAARHAVLNVDDPALRRTGWTLGP